MSNIVWGFEGEKIPFKTMIIEVSIVIAVLIFFYFVLGKLL